jgi:uncharacterized protein (DUF302 family)
MQSSATAGIDLPLRILVTEDETNGTVLVTTNEIDYLVRRHSIDDETEAIMSAQMAVKNFVSVAIGEA